MTALNTPNKERSASSFGGDNFRIAQAMSQLCKGRVPEFEEARRYASEQCADGDDGINFREGFAMKYGAALGAD